MTRDRGRLHVAEWACEFAGTATQLFVGFSVVALVSDQTSPTRILSPDLRFATIGLTFGILAALVAISPLGRRSGAHLNPAVTLGFWLRGHVHRHDLVAYAASQALGALVATGAFVLLWGRGAAEVNDAVTMPAPSVGALGAVAIESALTAILLGVLFAFLSSARFARWTPLGAVGALTVLIWAAARLTGASFNPARSLAPAIVAGHFGSLWIYLIAPPLGAAIAATGFGALVPRRPMLTLKMCGEGDPIG
jgi:aquaporin Z